MDAPSVVPPNLIFFFSAIDISPPPSLYLTFASLLSLSNGGEKVFPIRITASIVKQLVLPTGFMLPAPK